MAWKIDFAEDLPFEGGCVVAIGNFDGVHDGHKAVIAAAREEAEARGLACVALTFEPHPRVVLQPGEPLVRLNSPQEKIELLHGAGVDGVAVMPFDRVVAGWSAQAFVEGILHEWLQAKVVCVGEGFRFGNRAAGDVELLRRDGRLEVRTVVAVKDEGGVISSSRLREERDAKKPSSGKLRG